MGLQKGWPDFLLIAPGGRLHALELKRGGKTMTEEQEDFEVWCREQGVPFACTDNLREALATFSEWGVLRHGLLGRLRRGRP